MTHFRPQSALAVAREIQAGNLSPQEALRFSRSAIEGHEKTLKVFSHLPGEWVAGEGPLGGIAVGVKDIFDTHDMPTAYGSGIYPGHRPAGDASVVSMLRRAGATIAGKTVTTEFAWFSPGETRNPHNLSHTPGGSSSGSAAGVAAGFFPAAIGSQTGGSIIRPAAFCGIAGYKPSFRLFPTVGMKTFSWSLDTTGFFSATVADAAFVAAACSGRDLEVTDIQDMPRIGLYVSTIDDLATVEMKEVITSLRAQIVQAGAQVVEIKGPDLVEEARQAHAPIQDFEACLALADEADRHSSKLTSKLRHHLEEAQSITPQAYDDARRLANRARKAAHDLFSTCDVLLLPSATGAAPAGLESTGDSVFNRLWTLLGLPCVNVPGLYDRNGLPLGVQIVAPFGRDKRALNAANWLEQVIQTGR